MIKFALLLTIAIACILGTRQPAAAACRRRAPWYPGWGETTLAFSAID